MDRVFHESNYTASMSYSEATQIQALLLKG